jgi:hypothetical protein
MLRKSSCSPPLLKAACVLACCCCSALHFVAAIGNVKCIKLLADAGADLNLQDKEGERQPGVWAAGLGAGTCTISCCCTS